MYKTLRSVHLLLASACLPFLVLYGLSAVQMAHGSWFTMKPSVRDSALSLPPGLTDARVVAAEVTRRAPAARGELTGIKAGADDLTLRLVLPGTVHEVRYQRTSGETRLKTSVGGTMAMLNRLHHAAGLWHEPLALRLWGWVVGVVSAALMVTGATGIWMWFARRSERRLGAVLLLLNLVVAIGLLVMMRLEGP